MLTVSSISPMNIGSKVSFHCITDVVLQGINTRIQDLFFTPAWIVGTRKLTDVTLVDLITSRLLRSRLSIFFLNAEDHPRDSDPQYPKTGILMVR